MSDTIPPPPMGDKPTEFQALFRLINDFRSDVMAELASQRQQWGEAEVTLLARGRLHKSRLDEHESALEELKSQFEHWSAGIESRIDEIVRKTEPSPPPDLDG